MKNTLIKTFRRLRQPSSMAGLSALLLLAGIPPGTVDLAIQAGAALAALLAVVIDDGSTA